MHQQYKPRLTFKDKFNLVAGVILPAIAITVEAGTQLSSEFFLDPIPTVWHLLMAIFVPLGQLHVWFTIRRGTPDRLMLAGFVNAVAIAVSLFYSICYLPFVPLAIMTVVVVFGLLLLSPFLSLLAAISMRRQLKQIAATIPQQRFALRTTGLLAVLAVTFGVIVLIELPAALTRYGLQMAASSSAQTRTRGIRFLRSYGSKDQLLRSCYNRSHRMSGMLGGLLSRENPVDTDEVRRIYYRVTGEPFDLSPPPARVAAHSIPHDYENDQGGARIAGKLKDLSLSDSKLDGTIDSDGGVAQLYWTLTFQNDSYEGKQARAQIQLPPGGVVTRVTLFEKDDAIEAKFDNRRRIEHETPVPYSHEPLIVTTAGRDRILVQAFLSGHEMKFRLGITAPLVLESRSRVRLLLPHFEGRNFRIPDNVNHKVWFESTRSIATEYDGLYYGPLPSDTFVLGGQLSDQDLSRPERSLLISRFDRDAGIWSRNPLELPDYIVKQSIEERTPVHLRRIVVVVDTSASMAKWEPQISAALSVLPRHIDLKLVFADSEWQDETEHNDFVADGIDEAYRHFASATFTGGADNVPALQKAWELAAQAPGNNAIVWIHHPQLVELESVEKLRRRWEYRPYGPSLYSVQTTIGPDEITRRLDGINEVKPVRRTGTLRADLERLFKQLSGQMMTFEFVRSVKQSELAVEPEGYKTSELLAKLWANDEVVRLLSARDASKNSEASGLGMRYKLVTSVTDAAVRDSTRDALYINTKPITQAAIGGVQIDAETLWLGAVLFTIALVCMKCNST